MTKTLSFIVVVFGLISACSSNKADDDDKVLVATGFIEGEGLENARVSEVIDVTNTDKSCNNLDEAPTQRWASVGGVIKGRPLICGGFNGVESFKDCFYVEGEQAKNLSMTRIRSFATSLVLQDPDTKDDYMWIVGGFDKEDLSTTEFLSPDRGALAGPTLDFPIGHHCMVQAAPNAIYIIGGKQSGEMSPKVWIADPTDGFRVRAGPSLREKRYFHSCAVMEKSQTGQEQIVVAGGFGPAENGAVEILDTSSPDNQWMQGPKLPSSNLFAGQMVTHPGTQGTAVLAVAGNQLFSLTSGDQAWKASTKTIQYGRMMPVVMTIPGSLATCHATDLYDDVSLINLNQYE